MNDPYTNPRAGMNNWDPQEPESFAIICSVLFVLAVFVAGVALGHGCL